MENERTDQSERKRPRRPAAVRSRRTEESTYERVLRAYRNANRALSKSERKHRRS